MGSDYKAIKIKPTGREKTSTSLLSQGLHITTNVHVCKQAAVFSREVSGLAGWGGGVLGGDNHTEVLGLSCLTLSPICAWLHLFAEDQVGLHYFASVTSYTEHQAFVNRHAHQSFEKTDSCEPVKKELLPLAFFTTDYCC